MKTSYERLREILVEELSKVDCPPVKLPFDDKFLNRLLFERYSYFKEFAPSLKEVLNKIDYGNVNFDGFRAYKFDFSPYFGIKINPQNIYDKDLRCAICKGVEFIGPFDNVKVEGTNFTGSIGSKIHPQLVFRYNLKGTICKDVEFIGPFNCVIVENADFTGSKGAKIDPQTIDKKNLSGAKCSDVEFISLDGGTPNFYGVNITETDFTGSNYEEPLKEEEEFRQKIKQIFLQNNIPR